MVHVGRQSAQIRQAPLSGLVFDMKSLSLGVGNSRDCRPREALCHAQRQRSPTAAELQNLLAVGEGGVLDGLVYGPGFGLRERQIGKIVKTAGIFSART